MQQKSNEFRVAINRNIDILIDNVFLGFTIITSAFQNPKEIVP